MGGGTAHPLVPGAENGCFQGKFGLVGGHRRLKPTPPPLGCACYGPQSTRHPHPPGLVKRSRVPNGVMCPDLQTFRPSELTKRFLGNGIGWVKAFKDGFVSAIPGQCSIWSGLGGLGKICGVVEPPPPPSWSVGSGDMGNTLGVRERFSTTKSGYRFGAREGRHKVDTPPGPVTDFRFNR